MLKKSIVGWVVVGVVAIGSLQAQASERFDNFRYAMGIAGFGQQLTRNVVADGWTYDFGQTFSNTEYDFGNAELTLNGTMVGQAVISNRGIPEIELNLSTPTGIFYDLLATDGPNKLTIDNGFFNVEQKIIINQYGGYNIQMRVTNQGTLVCGDSCDETALNFDIGPIDVNGHWLVDVVNLTLGQWCGFTLPGGGLDQIVLGWEQLMQDQMAQVAGSVESNPQVPAGITVAAVPEPVCLSLLVLGAGIMVGRRR
jgi:hypothetical protein